MSFLKNIFGSGEDKIPYHSNFQEGDIFYTKKEGKYQIFKLLKIDPENEATFHVMGFEETYSVPKPNEIENLKIKIYHFPITKTGFNRPKLVVNSEVTDDDLFGYFEYIKQTKNVNEIAKYAKRFYQQAFELTNQNNFIRAIEKYSKAIELLPNFYEAIDNRAMTFMDIGKWEKAIEGFQQSLKVKPDGYHALFGIAVCYNQLNENDQAIDAYSKAIELDSSQYTAIDNRALIYKKLGLYDKAIQDFTKSLDLNQNGFIASLSLGQCYLILNQPENALQYLNTAHKINPNNELTIECIKIANFKIDERNKL